MLVVLDSKSSKIGRTDAYGNSAGSVVVCRQCFGKRAWDLCGVGGGVLSESSDHFVKRNCKVMKNHRNNVHGHARPCESLMTSLSIDLTEGVVVQGVNHHMSEET